jgi:hypothetical protein
MVSREYKNKVRAVDLARDEAGVVVDTGNIFREQGHWERRWELVGDMFLWFGSEDGR